MATEIIQKQEHKFLCELCLYSTCRSDNYAKHLLTAKHKKIVNIKKKVGEPNLKDESSYLCEQCTKKYKSRVGLWRHKKKCSQIIENTMVLSSPNIHNNLILELLKQNGELIKQNGELQKQLVEISKVA